MKSLRRKRKPAAKPESYKPPAFPSFSVCNYDGVSLGLDEDDIGKTFAAKIKFTGFNKRKNTSGKNELDWSFEVQSINI